MKAKVGDRIVVASAKLDTPARDGEIVAVAHRDGSPPYLVQWSDSGHRCLVFPGPDARIQSSTPGAETEATVSLTEPHAPHVRSWHVRIDLFETDESTSAHAVLVTEAPHPIEARASVRRRPGDPDAPEVGAEMATARALRRLADRLQGVADEDLVDLSASGR
jgi:hypothetical protein